MTELELAKNDRSIVGYDPEQDLDASVIDLLRESRASSTWTTYGRDRVTIEEWCETRGVTALPATPATVANYVGAMWDDLAPATIERRVAMWSAWHKAHGYTGDRNPVASEVVRKALQGLRRATSGERQKEARPLLEDDLARIFESIPGTTLADLRDKALLTVGFHLGRRRSELVSLDVEDLSRTPSGPQGARVMLRRSKTDQEGRGEALWLPSISKPYCPVKALEVWLQASGIRSGAIFRRVRSNGTTGGRLSDRWVSEVVKRRAKEAGLEGEWSGHSLRAGFVTDRAIKGASTHSIARQTGHSPTSPVLHRYVRVANPWEGNAVMMGATGDR